MSWENETWYKSIKNLLIIVAFLLGIPIIFCIVHCVYPVDTKSATLTNIGAGDLLGFIGGYLAFAGTSILGYATIKNSIDNNKRVLALEEKNYLLRNRLKLLPNSGQLRIKEDWTDGDTNNVGGISQLAYDSEAPRNFSKNYILYLKYNNFVAPVKLRVNKITIWTTQAHHFINASRCFNFGFMSELPDQLIPVAFCLNFNEEELDWLKNDQGILTVKGDVDVLSNEDVVSKYIFRFLYHRTRLDEVQITTKYIGAEIIKENIDE